MTTVSVIVPSYNSARFVTRTVESALALERRADEVIVVDDGSTDDTEAVLAPYRDRVVYVKQENRGVSEARNAGIARAKGRWAVFLDADDLLEPSALGMLLGEGRGDGPDRLIHGDTIEIDAKGEVIRRRASTDMSGEGRVAVDKFFEGGSVPPSSFVAPLEVVRRVGGFDPRFAYAADLHIWLKCASHVPVVHVPAPVLRYRIHDASMSRSQRNAFCEIIDCRVEFQRWCKENGLPGPSCPKTEIELLERFASEYYYRRAWPMLDLLLDIARIRGHDGPGIARYRRRRLVPPWVFRLWDRWRR